MLLLSPTAFPGITIRIGLDLFPAQMKYRLVVHIVRNNLIKYIFLIHKPFIIVLSVYLDKTNLIFTFSTPGF